MPELVIRNADVITPNGIEQTAVAIEDGLIVAMGADLPGGKSEYNAAGLTILPALIDVHLHFNEPGRTEWEGAASGSRALAAAGGTLFFDMPLNSSPCTIRPEHFDEKRAALEQSSITDFALWGGLVPGNVDALPGLAERGVVGFKAFLCDSGLADFPRADDLTLYEGMRAAADLNLPVAVHAESEEITKALTHRMLTAKRRDARAFLESRPVIAEVEAIERAALLARETGCRLHVVHVSSGRGVAAALEARSRGTDISIETCPHYLAFTEEDLLRIGGLAKCAPPLRTEAERQALWAFIMYGQVDIVASDHSPCPPEMKTAGDFFEIWGGIGGVQFTLPVLLDEGNHRRNLSLQRIAKLTATNPARRFRIKGRGTIEVGNHADLNVVDCSASAEVTHSSLLQRHRISPYEGRRFQGIVRRTYRSGELIFSDGRITAERLGTFISPCST